MFSLTIEDMTCQHCVASITRAVQGVAPGAQVTADLTAHRVDVAQAPDQTAVERAITQAGFSVTPL